MQGDERIDLSAQRAPRNLTRREFVRKLSAAAGSAGLITAAFTGCALSRSQRAEATEAVLDGIGKVPKVKLNKRLGGMEVGRVVICQDNSPALLQPCIEAGMNFVHKAGYYRSGLPEELKKLPRDSYFVDTTVDNTSPGHEPTNEEEAYNQVITELDKTGMKYFDVFRAHYGWRTLDSFNNGNNASYKAFTRLKKEGKVKYFGVSQHTGNGDYEPYAKMIQAQIDSGLIDTMQVWLSYATKPEELAIFEKAHKSGISITAMKVNAHGAGKMSQDAAKQAELKTQDMVHRACLRYVFDLKGANGKPWVDMAVTSLRNFSHFEENVGAVANKVALADGFHIVSA
jgi:aryl-alcohol dehydrogenase-like predicted oxidoreductase